MRIGYGNPRFEPRISEGKYPKNLTLGFENEVEMLDDDMVINEALENFNGGDNFLYAKEDGSLSNGAEINSQPFNFNWFLENREVLNFTSYLNEKGVGGTDSCGFHIHFNRFYFSDKHLRRLLKLVYNAPKFWGKISQRDGKHNLYEYSSLENFKERLRERYGNNSISWRNMNKVIRNNGFTSHYDALDLRGSCSTIEFRIFRGTTNPNLIQTYLEVAMAMVMYTQETEFCNITIKGFVQYVYNNSALYPKAVHSNILKGKCKYRWDKYQPLVRS